MQTTPTPSETPRTTELKGVLGKSYYELSPVQFAVTEFEQLERELAAKERELVNQKLLLQKAHEHSALMVDFKDRIATNLTTLQPVARELAEQLYLHTKFMTHKDSSNALTTYNSLPPEVRGKK